MLKRWLEKLKEASGRHGYTCDGCGTELYDYPQNRLCSACVEKLERNEGRVCVKCGRKTISEGVCLSCKNNPPLFHKGISPFVYRAETALLVNRIKNGDRRLAFFFGECLAKSLLDEYRKTQASGTPVLLIPVPLTKAKLRERGYNQAEELAKATYARLREEIPVTIDTEALEKKRETEQQKHLRATERKKNAVGAYHLHKRTIFQGATVFLVDDILTTGATGNACAKLFYGAGAKTVCLLTIASLPEKK